MSALAVGQVRQWVLPSRHGHFPPAHGMRFRVVSLANANGNAQGKYLAEDDPAGATFCVATLAFFEANSEEVSAPSTGEG